ncbi:hypothetical protein RMR16_024880 (plasmid) [Agrobacterium sp. rho-13.3]|uniref:hypothetical protein n=1 Tax=Agrobacterium sp. rho-13.3 TaxID=3072980 RepID=UPI002A1652B5|nr:hypothetical protein [Agrobacterium sp. rho-13.3]MDX8310188.1 hypothetical protein [Agrobacterium sp. rho-13.3]
MNWVSTVVDIQRIQNSSYHLALLGADKNHFSASAVVVINLESNQLLIDVEVPLTPWPWISMAQNCAGNHLVITGAEFMHHTLNNGVLAEHPQDIVFRSGRLWRASDDWASYCGGDRVVSIMPQLTQEDVLNEFPRLAHIHGLHSQFKVLVGSSGLLMVNRGQGWSRVEDVPTLSDFVDVICVSENEMYLSAGDGGVFRWDGSSDWWHYDTEPGLHVNELCRYKGDTYIASLNSKSYRLAGDKVEHISQSLVAGRFSTDGELLFGLGQQEKFEIFDGNNWRMLELDLHKIFPSELAAMYAAAPVP